jgi:hypothetical protein
LQLSGVSAQTRRSPAVARNAFVKSFCSRSNRRLRLLFGGAGRIARGARSPAAVVISRTSGRDLSLMRFFACSAFFVAVLASTCNASPGAQARPFRVVTLLPPAGGAPFSYAEPTLAIRDRTILVVAATANAGVPPTFWISRDAGASWTAGANFDNTGSSTGDADVAIGADGELYALNLGFNNPPGQPTNPTVLVFHSADGVAWSGPATFPLPHGLDQPDRPWLFTDPVHPARVNVVHNEVGGNVVLWRSTDHGATFQGPITVTGGASGQAALELSSRPLFDPTNDARIYVLYETVAPAGLASGGPPGGEFPITQVWLAVSTDAGESWSNALVLDSSSIGGGILAHLLVASAIDSAGNLFAAFSLRPSESTETHLFLIHSTDHGITWSAPSQVDSVLPSNVMPAIATGAGGALFVSWYASSSPDFQDMDAAWREEFAQTTDALSAQPAFTETTLSGPAPVHVGDINVAGNPGFQIGKNWGLRDLQSVAVDRCGLPHPVWAVDFGGTSTQTAVPSAACTLATPLNVVSRKTHGLAGPFDINLPLTGNPGIECRKGQGANSKEHQVVASFAAPVTLSSASVTSGTGSVASTTVSGNEVFVKLTGIANAQTITVTLFGATVAGDSSDVTVPISFLPGDTTANRAVNSSDVSQTKSQSGKTLTTSNFRTDVTVNGSINSSDISLVKSKSGTALP